jgi:hypothetical protein
MNDLDKAALMVKEDTDLAQEADNSIQTLYYPYCMFRASVQDDLTHMQRMLRPTGILIIQTYLAPTKKHRPVYVEALVSTLQGKRVHLHNEYEWLRMVKAANLLIMKQTKNDIPVEVEMMDIPQERIEKAKVLLHQCPSDLLEFIEPVFPPQGRLGYVVRQLELILQKATSETTV